MAKSSSKAEATYLKLDAVTWSKYLQNKSDASECKTDVPVHNIGKAVVTVQRCGEDLVLRSDFQPSSPKITLLPVKVSAQLIFDPKIDGVEVKVSDISTLLLQGDSGSVLLFLPIPWDRIPPNTPVPKISVIICESGSTSWKGLDPMRPLTTFHIDCNKQLPSNGHCSQHSQKVWRCMVNLVYGDWWIWLPPLDLSGLLAKTSKGPPPCIVSYMKRHENVNKSGQPEMQLRLHASLSGMESRKPTEVQFALRSAQVAVKFLNSTLLSCVDGVVSEEIINNREKSANHFDMVARFSFLKSHWVKLDPEFAPMFKLSVG